MLAAKLARRISTHEVFRLVLLFLALFRLVPYLQFTANRHRSIHLHYHHERRHPN
jgi:hypothetical protein